MVSVRAAARADLAAIKAIYDHYVLKTPATFDIDPPPLEAWEDVFDSHAGRFHLLVATEDPSGAPHDGGAREGSGAHEIGGAQDDGGARVVGFAKTGEVRPKRAYDTSVQVSVYCAPDATGRGVGTALYEALFAALDGADLHRAYAYITLPNPASVALHERFGFAHRGTMTEVGRKFGRYHDVATYEKPL